jgi:hypothetical protein
MTRRYDDPVDVRRRDEVRGGGPALMTDAPAEFLWRGRLYVVRGVLAHWIETGAWWRSRAAQATYGVGSAQAESVEPPTVDPTVDTERELWRVEASGGRARGSGVYDLCFDWTAGAWTLARALD